MCSGVQARGGASAGLVFFFEWYGDHRDLRYFRTRRSSDLGVVDVVGSTIARETGRGIFLHAGPEISVASTKAFTCQVSVLLMIALRFARSRRMSRDEGMEFVKTIEAIPSLVERVLERNDEIAKVAEHFMNFDNIFFIGRGYLYPVALDRKSVV